MTLEEVASRVGTSREAVRQLQVRALRCLRQAMEEEGWSGVEG
ncbi:MAG: sigma factor-like helix-turn-helix DNA-binding protein [Pseudomonadota bacterium]